MAGHFKIVVYHVSRYGLCNRLRALAAMQAIAEIHQAELKMLWEPGITCPAHFHELFEPVCESVSTREIELIKEREGTKVVAGNAAGNRPESYASGEAFQASWRRHVRELLPLPEIQQKIDAYQASTWNDYMVGVHVRRTDAVGDRGRRLGLTFSDEPIIAAMRELVDREPRTKFLFATDNQETLSTFETEFGERIQCYPKAFERFDPGKHKRYGSSSTVGHRHTSVRDAVIDLWLLSRTRQVIGTKASSFSEYASWIGDIPLRRL